MDKNEELIGPSGNMEYLFIAITPRFNLIQSGSNYYGLIYRSNRTVWPFNCVQAKIDVRLNC